MMKFPNGKHDDQIDVLGMIGRMLDTMIAGKEAPEKRSKDIKVTKPTMREIMKKMEAPKNDEW
jgi:hypothetical protein